MCYNSIEYYLKKGSHMTRKILVVISVILILATALSCLCYATNQITGPDSYNFPKAEDFPDDGPTSVLITDDEHQKKRDISLETTQYFIESFEAEIDLNKDDGVTVVFEILDDGKTRQIDEKDYNQLIKEKGARADILTFHLGFRGDHEVYYEVKHNVSDMVGVRGYAFVKNPNALSPVFYFSENFLFTGGYPVPYGTNIIGYASCSGNNSIVRVGFTNVLVETITGFKSVANAASSVTHRH